ncbi:MAG: NmrA family NAD(P)-binding protein, partial [bacterium]
MTTPKILVTGAGGKTASYVVEQLIEEGFPVRALVRRLDERSD